MTRVIYWTAVIIAAILVVQFAADNRAVVTLSFLIFPDFLTNVPLFAVIYGAIFVGFLFGAVIAWLSGGRARRRARTLSRQLERLERDYEGLQEKLDAAAREQPDKDAADRIPDHGR